MPPIFSYLRSISTRDDILTDQEYHDLSREQDFIISQVMRAKYGKPICSFVRHSADGPHGGQVCFAYRLGWSDFCPHILFVLNVFLFGLSSNPIFTVLPVYFLCTPFPEFFVFVAYLFAKITPPHQACCCVTALSPVPCHPPTHQSE